MKKINPFYVIAALAVMVIAIGSIVTAYTGPAPQVVVEGNLVESESEMGLRREVSVQTLNLIGISTTTPFEFASSTDTVYWDTTIGFPHEYGATPTAPFLINGAYSVSMNIWYTPVNITSQVEIRLSVSNDVGCNNSVIANNVSTWFPLPAVASTSPEISGSLVLGASATTSAITLAPTSVNTQKYSYVLPQDYLGYYCMKVEAYNSSTTDNSLLWVEANILR